MFTLNPLHQDDINAAKERVWWSMPEETLTLVIGRVHLPDCYNVYTLIERELLALCYL